MAKTIELFLNNDIDEIQRLHGFIEEKFAENNIDPNIIFSFDLSLDELVTNIISYGLDDKEGHEIKLYFELNENSIKCTVSDTGIEFDPFNAPEPDTNIPLEDRQIGGLGIHFIRKMMDNFEYKRDNGRNIVILEKKIN